ncbi:hypothetical protein ACX3O0_01540 [Homoserinimonas sp. A447]
MVDRSVRRALAAGVVLAVLVPALAGCSAGETDIEARLSELPGVSGAFVWTTTSGLPTNRGYAIRLYVAQEPGDDLTGLVDDALRTTWSHAAFKPTNGIDIEVSEGDRPDEPERLQTLSNSIEIGEAVTGLSWGDGYVGQGTAGLSATVSRHALEIRYGEWSDAG